MPGRVVVMTVPRHEVAAEKGTVMAAILLVLLLAVLLFGLGFSLHLLWIAAAIVLILWLVGFMMRGAEGARWYRW